MRFDAGELETLLGRSAARPAAAARPQLVAALRALDGFAGEIDALPEGTPAFAGPALRIDGKPVPRRRARASASTRRSCRCAPISLRAKLIETPWLGRINYMSMVASKAARVVDAARGKPVLEFGARRTPSGRGGRRQLCRLDLAGCAATSNVAALRR